jgi:hypothetical protein
MSDQNQNGKHGDEHHASRTRTLPNGEVYNLGPYIGDDVAELKARISYAALLRHDGHALQRSGKNLICSCPFHHDSTPSFAIYNDNSAHCFGCGWHGDVIAYLEKRERCDFQSAVTLLQDYLESGVLKAKAVLQTGIAAPPPPRGPYVFTKDEERHAANYSQTLRESRRLCELIAESRGWKPETIEQLARSGDLGWTEQSIAFIYNAGVKLRPWPWKREGIRWAFGKPSLWRGRTIGCASKVYLTEGETDAITMIDSGICTTTGRTAVALPSATTFKPEWANQLKGRIVHLLFDNDPAGEQAILRVNLFLRGAAKEIYTVNWKEAGHGL